MDSKLINDDEIIAKSQIQPGMHVADFGCGRTGHITIAAAKVVGSEGIVYATDIIKEFLEDIRKKAQMINLNNISPVWTNLEIVGSTKIPEASLQAVFITNILARAKEKINILNEAKRLLKDKGRIVVVDWKKTGLSFGPKENELLSFNEIVDWATQNNFSVQEEFYPGEYHRGMVLYRHE